MSKLNVNTIEPSTGTDVTLGASGDTITVPSGATFTQSGTMNASAITAGTIDTARLGSGTASSSTVLYGDQTYKAEPTGVALTGSTDNTVVTVTGANAIAGEATFTYNGTTAEITGSAPVMKINSTADSSLQFLAGTSSTCGIQFGDSGDSGIGSINYVNTDDSIRVSVNGGEQVRIFSNGVIAAADGIALGAGIANTAANVLDDYEEGTFTPTMVPTTAGTTTYTTQAGYYVKVGKFVQITGGLGWSAQTGSGQPRVGGLPFAISSEDSNYGTNGLGMTDLTLTSTDYQAALVPQPSGSYANIHECKSGSRSAAPHDASAFISMGMTYGTLS